MKMTVKEAAEYCGVTTATILNRIKRKLIKGQKQGSGITSGYIVESSELVRGRQCPGRKKMSV